jgi:hypothetical protein
MWEIQARCLSRSKRVAATAVGIIQLSPLQVWELLTLPGKLSASSCCCVVAVWPSCSHERDQAMELHETLIGNVEQPELLLLVTLHFQILEPRSCPITAAAAPAAAAATAHLH